MISKFGRQRKDWVETAMSLAETIAMCRSQDPYMQVGACGVKLNGEVVLGYNGPPCGIEVDWSDRDGRRKYMLHAEYNVIKKVDSEELSILAVTHMPCPECLKSIADKKVFQVYYRHDGGVNYAFSDTERMAEFLKIQLIKI